MDWLSGIYEIWLDVDVAIVTDRLGSWVVPWGDRGNVRYGNTRMDK